MKWHVCLKMCFFHETKIRKEEQAVLRSLEFAPLLVIYLTERIKELEIGKGGSHYYSVSLSGSREVEQTYSKYCISQLSSP